MLSLFSLAKHNLPEFLHLVPCLPARCQYLVKATLESTCGNPVMNHDSKNGSCYPPLMSNHLFRLLRHCLPESVNSRSTPSSPACLETLEGKKVDEMPALKPVFRTVTWILSIGQSVDPTALLLIVPVVSLDNLHRLGLAVSLESV